MTIVAVVTQAFGRYCLESDSPAFAHVWVMAVEAIAVTIAMYCIIQFYWQIKDDIRQHQPILKVVAIKLVIFLSFWQTIIISFLTSTNIIKPNNDIQMPDIKVGLPNFMLCVEMAFFAFFHFFAFSWKPYTKNSKVYQAEATAGEREQPLHYQGGFLGLKAMADASNPWDMIKAIGRAGRWLFVGRKRRMQDPSYQVSRADTDDTMRFDSNAYSGTKLNPMGPSTEYTGAKKDYTRASEDRQPLVYGQTNPFSEPGRDHSPYTLTGVDSRSTRGDIGVAKSTFGDDSGEDEWESRGRTYPPAPAIHVSHPSYQETGVTAAPYPDHYHEQNQGPHNGVSMPYYEQPPPHSQDMGRRYER